MYEELYLQLRWDKLTEGGRSSVEVGSINKREIKGL